MNDLFVKQRLAKAIEVKTNLKQLQEKDFRFKDIDEHESMISFSKILSDWVRDGSYTEGTIKFEKVKLVYRLTKNSPKNTFVKFGIL
jgi:hypothetical protein